MGKPAETLEQTDYCWIAADDEGPRHSNVVPAAASEQRLTVRAPAFATPIESEVHFRHAEAPLDELFAESTDRPSVRPTLHVPGAASAASRSDAAQRRSEGGYSQVVARRRLA